MSDLSLVLGCVKEEEQRIEHAYHLWLTTNMFMPMPYIPRTPYRFGRRWTEAITFCCFILTIQRYRSGIYNGKEVAINPNQLKTFTGVSVWLVGHDGAEFN